MKTFIIFIGLLIVCLSFICFAADMDAYIKMQDHVKALAEECACGAVLMTDAEEYSQGYYVIDGPGADSYINFMLRSAEENMYQFRNGSLSASYRFFDDKRGYADIKNYGIKRERPCGVVTITYTGRDIFRLPFLELSSFSRTAVYQWDGL